ncbi:MAG: hypothetical protein JST73_03615 [Actinobacteria bacterium]|nr:hypothetical protein [Actinomycetota bacterium]
MTEQPGTPAPPDPPVSPDPPASSDAAVLPEAAASPDTVVSSDPAASPDPAVLPEAAASPDTVVSSDPAVLPEAAAPSDSPVSSDRASDVASRPPAAQVPLSASTGEPTDPQRPMLQPVHWGARLGVAPDACYSEVGDSAVAVLCGSAQVLRLSGDLAALVVKLDGRPLAESLADELASWGAQDRRRAIEVVRRLKVLGLLYDVPDGEQVTPPDWATEPAIASDVTLAAAVATSAPATSAGAVIHLGMATTATRATSTVTLAIDQPVAGLVLPVDETRPTRVVPGLADPSPDAPESPDAIDVLVALVSAVTPRSTLAEPGVVDLLALIAEATPSTWAPTPPPGSVAL